MSQTSDRNLLIGVLALQLDFVSRDELVEAMTAWSHAKGRGLEEIFFERELVDKQTRQLLGSLVDKRLHRVEQAASASAASRPPSIGMSRAELDTLQTQLEAVDDPDLQVSIRSLLPGARQPGDAAPEDTERSAENRKLTVTNNLETLPQTEELADPGSRYVIVRPHARGGLGEVSVALDTELNRQVALKQIRAEHADDGLARQRFLLEAEVTGGLEHPGVVPVYGLGQNQDGRPYYAMRLIRGESLREAVDRFHAGRKHDATGADSLEFRKLLVRFVEVCQAIAYAHSRGVLHRDLKPENIMLGPYGETLVVDWGLAKAEGSDSETEIDIPQLEQPTESRLRPTSGSGGSPTRMGSVIGTPAFLSPEQADGRLDKIGPVSDVYSLGATLYYILTGKVAALARDSSRQPEVGTILQRVRTGDFPRPRELRPEVPRALEAVCLKAMALQPAHRYASAGELAEDVERYLADEPVTAHRDSLLIRSRRWLRRHQTLATTAAALVLISVVGLTVFSSLLSAKQRELTATNRQLRVAQQEAFEAAETAERKRREAEQERIKAEQATLEALDAKRNTAAFSQFLTANILATARPKGRHGGLGIDVTVVEALEEAEGKVAQVFAGRPQAEATARDGIGGTWYDLGKYKKAAEHQSRAIELFEQNNLSDDRYYHALGSYASTLLALGRVEDAIEIGQRVEQAFLNRHGPRDEASLAASNNLARAYLKAGNYEEAQRRLERVVEVSNELYGEHSPKTFPSRINLAEALRMQAPPARQRALQIMQSVLEDQQTQLGDQNLDTLITQNNIANFYLEQGDSATAVGMLSQVLELLREAVGPAHPLTIDILSNLGKAQFVHGQTDAGLASLKQAWQLSAESLSEEHPDTLVALDLYANHLGESGETARAIKLLEEVLEARRRVLGDDHADTLTTMNNLAMFHDSVGNVDRALELHAESVRRRGQALGVESPAYRLALGNYATAAFTNNRLDLAAELFQKLFDQNLQMVGPESPETWESLQQLATVQIRLGQFQAGIDNLDRALQMMRPLLPAGDPWETNLLYTRGLAFRDAGLFSDAAEVFRDLVNRQRKIVEANPGDIGPSMLLRGLCVELAECENELQRYESAAGHARESVALAKQLIPDDWRLFNAQSVLGESLFHLDRAEEAERLLVESHQGLKDRFDSIPALTAQARLLKSFDRLIDFYSSAENTDAQRLWQQRKQEFLDQSVADESGSR